MPRLSLIKDSAAISKFLECEQLHDYEHTQSIVQINKNDPALTFQIPDKMSMGTLGHKYLEIYYKNLKGESAFFDSQVFAARTALDFDPDKADKIEPEFPLSADMRAKVRKRFEDYLMNYGVNDYKVATTSIKYIKAEGNLLVDALRDEPLVERGFSFPLLDTSEYLFVLEGKIDFIGSQGGECFWMDHKWQLRERKLYKKSVQFRDYALATGLPLGIINYIRLHEKLSKFTFVREPISFSTGEISAWREELIEIFIRMAKTIQSGKYFKNRDSCSGKFDYPCPFTPICEIYNEEQRLAHIKQNYTKKKEWKPW